MAEGGIGCTELESESNLRHNHQSQASLHIMFALKTAAGSICDLIWHCIIAICNKFVLEAASK
ncbi:hypothetical protein DPMN_137552 [Dreissena polymorpha]|uniref:Uncharacterized protein n=1 Tax=Dreissena polymorpha TaxID=45954 RepID=A0A9D4G2R7_DREPO|nr:hypothetical protein DPMN_137552 [Dreissena polymorpha]